MKSKFLLLSLLAAAGLIAADAPAVAPAGTPPADAPKADKAEKGGDKAEGKKGAMPEVPGVSKEEMQKYQAARKTASETPEVKALKDGKDKKAYYEALNAAIIKADPSLADVAKKVDDFMKSKSKKPKGAKKPEGDAPAAAPAAAPETK
ncbi:MAG: hypothetical protein WCP40_01035 [Opitutae bacterium]